MVRCLGVLLVLALLLCGCAQNTAEPTAPTDNLDSSTDIVTGLYVPDSAIEQATDGAVRAFRLEDGYYGCAMLGDELILMRKTDEEGTLTFYRGENLEEGKSVSLGKNVTPTTAQMQISEQGIGYFDSENKDVVFLNRDLVETGRMHLPAEMQGDAWLTPDWQMVYYCTDKGVHAMNLQTGISRLLVEQAAFSQQITGGFGNGEVLRYVLEVTQGQKQTLLIDAKTGVTLQNGEAFEDLITAGEQYFLPNVIKGVRQLRFGNGQSHQTLWPAESSAEPVMLFDNNATVMIQSVEQELCNSYCLSYYDLNTGLRTSAVTLTGATEVWGIRGDGKGSVWLFARDAENVPWLYHWDSAKSPVEDTNKYTEPLYTPEEPNTQGLEQVARNAQNVGDKFGIDVLVWQNAAATAPADQFFTAEHMTQLYDHYLPRLERALSIFPEGFFSQSSMEKLQIALVQRITGEPAWGTLAETDCVQFLNGKTPVVAVTMGEDFERNLYHGVYLYMETRLLSKSAALYEWFWINPSDFAYDNNYITNLERTDTTYITGDNKYFIDLFSMSYAKEDRATIFEYACMPGNEDSFRTNTMQEKLKRICKGIREAYGLKKVETPFLWEQYLA